MRTLNCISSDFKFWGKNPSEVDFTFFPFGFYKITSVESQIQCNRLDLSIKISGLETHSNNRNNLSIDLYSYLISSFSQSFPHFLAPLFLCMSIYCLLTSFSLLSLSSSLSQCVCVCVYTFIHTRIHIHLFPCIYMFSKCLSVFRIFLMYLYM